MDTRRIGRAMSQTAGLRWHHAVLKRTLDVVVSAIGLLLCGWLILLAFLVATVDTRRLGFFTQKRVGRGGELFSIIKIRTMRDIPGITTTVTRRGDPRITRIGRLLRRSRIDELPQLINVLVGHMSLVGPRPDVPGFADRLKGEDRVILAVRPGITGPATLRFRDEEEELAAQPDPDAYNAAVIFPEKVRLNREYVTRYSLRGDLQYLLWTVWPLSTPRDRHRRTCSNTRPSARSGHPDR